MANLKLRFSIYSEDETEDISLLQKELPQQYLENVYRKGEMYKHHLQKESALDYVYFFKNISSIEQVNLIFKKQWNSYSIILNQKLTSTYKAYLLYDFDMDNSSIFPEMIFKKQFLEFLSNTGIELQLYFYPK